MSLPVALALLLAAAPARGGGRCVLEGRPPWRELHTAHFVLSTDLDEDAADELAEQLEVLRGAVLAMLEVADAIPGTLRVVAFARPADYRAFAPADTQGYFVGGTDGQAAVVLRGDGSRVRAALVVAHELTHHVLAHAYPRQPRWFAEGLASYAEALAEGTRGETVRIGRPPEHRLRQAQQEPVPSAELLAATGRLTLRQYATSWLLVHYLFAQHRDRFAAFRRRLARADDPAAAWRAEFPEWDPASPASTASLDRALARHADGGEYVETRLVARGEGAFRSTTLGAAEVHALRLRLLRGDDPAFRERLFAEADEALAEDPTHVAALWVRAAEARGRDPAAARAAAARHPGDPRAWALVGVLTTGEERLAALRRGVAVAGEDAAALQLLAEQLRVAGRAEEAWPVATRAARLAPWSSLALGTCADVALTLGRCGDAVAYAARALEVLPDAAAAGAPLRARAEERARGAASWCAPAPVPAR